MEISDIAIRPGGLDGDFLNLGRVTAKVSRTSRTSTSPTIEDVNLKLQQEAHCLGANAVIDVTYSRGMSIMSYEVLSASGTAVMVRFKVKTE